MRKKYGFLSLSLAIVAALIIVSFPTACGRLTNLTAGKEQVVTSVAASVDGAQVDKSKGEIVCSMVTQDQNGIPLLNLSTSNVTVKAFDLGKSSESTTQQRVAEGIHLSSVSPTFHGSAPPMDVAVNRVNSVINGAVLWGSRTYAIVVDIHESMASRFAAGLKDALKKYIDLTTEDSDYFTIYTYGSSVTQVIGFTRANDAGRTALKAAIDSISVEGSSSARKLNDAINTAHLALDNSMAAGISGIKGVFVLAAGVDQGSTLTLAQLNSNIVARQLVHPSIPVHIVAMGFSSALDPVSLGLRDTVAGLPSGGLFFRVPRNTASDYSTFIAGNPTGRINSTALTISGGVTQFITGHVLYVQITLNAGGGVSGSTAFFVTVP